MTLCLAELAGRNAKAFVNLSEMSEVSGLQEAVSAHSLILCSVILLPEGFCFIPSPISTPKLALNMPECFIILYAYHMASLNNQCIEVKKAHLSPFAVFWEGNDYPFPPTHPLKLYRCPFRAMLRLIDCALSFFFKQLHCRR